MNIRFHVGGPDYHPVDQQAQVIEGWLGEGFRCTRHHDREVFDLLHDTDLLIIMGLFCSPGRLPYTPLTREHELALESYIASGRPLLLHHGAAGSYDDSETFKRLIGVTWVWAGDRKTSHSPVGTYRVQVTDRDHPVTKDVNDFKIFDELYIDLATDPSITPRVLATAAYEGRTLPMVQVFEGGRTEGAGRAVYLANGHDLRAFECPAMRQLWTNSVRWLTGQAGTDAL